MGVTHGLSFIPLEFVNRAVHLVHSIILDLRGPRHLCQLCFRGTKVRLGELRLNRFAINMGAP